MSENSPRDYLLKPFSGPQEARDFLQNWLAALRPEWDAAAKAAEEAAKKRGAEAWEGARALA